MSRRTHSQLLLGDDTDARLLGYNDAMRGRPLEPGQVPRNVRAQYSRGFTRGEARAAVLAGIWS